MRIPVLLASLTLAAACSKQTPVATPETPAATAEVSTSEAPRKVRPQDDLYRHVNGKWLSEFKLPSDRADYGAFTKVADDAQDQLKVILEELASKKDIAQGSPEQKIRDFYAGLLSAANQTDFDKSGIADEFAAIDGIKSKKQLFKVFGSFQALGIKTPFSYGIGSDFKDPDRHAVYVSQSGLTLPDRDYYLEDSERFKAARGLYETYANDLLKLAGYEPTAKALLAFETELAKVSWTKEQRRDTKKTYNPKTMSGLRKLAPKTDWRGFLKATGVPLRKKYIVRHPSYITGMSKAVAQTDLETLKQYLRLQVLSRFASSMGKPSFDIQFAFSEKGLRGVKEPQPAWKRAVNSLNWTVGELLGQIYVKRHFPAAAKDKMQVMVNGLTNAYGESIRELDWMSDKTKDQALDKLSKFTPKIGYPDKWKDFSDLSIPTDAVQAQKNISRFWYERDIKNINKPVDKTEWGMAPQIVNAYFNPLWNEIVFPAAILQPPFFDLKGDDAYNYGAIGAVIGHEIGHGFDDSGAQFDGDGKLRNWWTDADAKEFERRKNLLAAQYDSFVAIEDLKINGQFTSGENIGDLGGLSIAYRAYRNSLNGKEAPVINGLTGDQRFFIGWARVWARVYTDAELKRRLVVDPHSPSEARVNQVVKNIPAFYEAFEVKEGDGMYLRPEDRVKIW